MGIYPRFAENLDSQSVFPHSTLVMLEPVAVLAVAVRSQPRGCGLPAGPVPPTVPGGLQALPVPTVAVTDPLPHCLHSTLPPNKGTLLSRHCMIMAKSYMCGLAGETGVAAQVHGLLLLDSCGSRQALASVKSAVLPSRDSKGLGKKTQKVG